VQNFDEADVFWGLGIQRKEMLNLAKSKKIFVNQFFYDEHLLLPLFLVSCLANSYYHPA